MFRIGIGHDTHRLLAGRRLVLGGVEVPHTHGSVAHSDGDVVLHAVIDALLGALAWGDIGEWFPDDDPQHANADSGRLLKQVVDKVHGHGWHIANVDTIVFAQRPKLSTYKSAMRQRMAELMNIAAEQVSVKAKTGEKVGPVGREEAICAEAIVLLQRKEDLHRSTGH